MSVEESQRRLDRIHQLREALRQADTDRESDQSKHGANPVNASDSRVLSIPGNLTRMCCI